MGQKATPVSSVKKNLTKAEKKIRQDVETTFAAIDRTLQPPEYFTADQKKIFNDLVEKLSATKEIFFAVFENLCRISIVACCPCKTRDAFCQ